MENAPSLDWMVCEYLLSIECKDSFQTFVEEVKSKGKRLTFNTETEDPKLQETKVGCSSFGLRKQQRMLQLFDAGHATEFLRLWDSIIPERSTEERSPKLEFYIRIYFAIFPIHSLSQRKVFGFVQTVI
jgi:hypothetical protein